MMRRILVLLMFTGIWVILLVGCIAEYPSELVMRGAHTVPHNYTVDEWQKACAKDKAFDLNRALETWNENEPLLWTFNISFSVLSPEGNPLGCLHLYERLNNTQAITIDNGGILVDTCYKNVQSGNVTIDTGSGLAYFDGGYIACDMDLNKWLTSLSTSSLASSLGTSQLLIDFARAEIQGTTIVSHEYENFTMRATFRVSDTGNVLPLIPIMSYIPHTTTTGTPITFSVAIKNIEDNMKGITASLPCTNPMTTPFSPIDEMADWWYDVRYDPRENLPSSLNFVAYGENSGYFRCQIDQNASPALPISFSISESTLYIGFDPIMDAYFTGTMESVLIDPTDSKPPD